MSLRPGPLVLLTGLCLALAPISSRADDTTEEPTGTSPQPSPADTEQASSPAPEKKVPLRRPGWFVAVAGLYAIELNAENVSRSIAGPTAAVSNGAGVVGRVGYQSSEWIGAEIRSEWATGFDATLAGAKVFQYDLLTTTFDVLMYWPGGPLGRFDPYLVVGVGFTRTRFEFAVAGIPDDTDYGVGFLVGLGTQFRIDDRWSITAELGGTSPGGVDSDTAYLSLEAGIRYQF